MTVGSDATRTWIQRYFEHCGAKDIDAAMEYWAPDGLLRFANDDPIRGRDNIGATFHRFVGNWVKETHTVLDLWELGDGVVIFELHVAFDCHNGSHVEVHGATVCRVDGERFLEQRTYTDMTPVFAQVAGARP